MKYLRAGISATARCFSSGLKLMQIKLGELLLKENMITPQQLQLAFNHQKMNGGTLQVAFVSLGFVKDEEIVQLLSRQFGVPSVDLHTFEVDPAVIRIIPVESARKYQVLPLSLDAKHSQRWRWVTPPTYLRWTTSSS